MASYNYYAENSSQVNSNEHTIVDATRGSSAFSTNNALAELQKNCPDLFSFSTSGINAAVPSTKVETNVYASEADFASASTISTSAIGARSQETYLSEVENSIIRSSNPIAINESEEITVNGQRGIWANKSEVVNWRGPVPITQYAINEDQNPEIITKRSNQTLDYIQELAIRYLRPPTPPAPGEIIIQQQANTLTPPAPPLIIRQQPPRPPTPEPLVIREAPPQPPSQVGRKVITISGKRLPPPPRKVIIERLAPLPAKPQSVIVERWLPYAQTKRRVIFQKAAQPDPVIVKPRNVIVQWEAPKVNIRQEIKYLGVVRANPAEYVQRFGNSLKSATEMPDYIANIKTPEGLVLAANYRYNSLHELEGDLQALKLVDLEREGLGEYRSYLQRLGIQYDVRSEHAIDVQSTVNAHTSNDFKFAETTNFTSNAYESVAASSAPSSQIGFSNSRLLNELAEQIFQSISRRHDDLVSVDDAKKSLFRLNACLGRNYDERDASSFLSSLHVNHDSTINYDEFKRAFYRILA